MALNQTLQYYDENWAQKKGFIRMKIRKYTLYVSIRYYNENQAKNQCIVLGQKPQCVILR